MKESSATSDMKKGKCMKVITTGTCNSDETVEDLGGDKKKCFYRHEGGDDGDKHDDKGPC